MDNREKLINIVIEAFRENNELTQYISLDEVKERLYSNIELVESLSEVVRGNACYGFFDKKISFLDKYDLENIDEETKRLIVHECLHALTSNIIENTSDNKKGKSGIMYIEISCPQNNFSTVGDKALEWGRGLNEGITQWLASKLTSHHPPSKTNLIKLSGIRGIKDESYPLEQILVEELAILYGEGNIIKAYLNNDTKFIFDEIGKNPQMSNAEKCFNDFSDLGDSINEIGTSILIFPTKSNRKEYKNAFIDSQEFFIEEFLKKEIDFALESGDRDKIKSISDKLQKLVELNIDIKGKGKLFNEIAEEFNSRCIALGNENFVDVKKDNVLEKIKQSFDKEEMMLNIGESMARVKIGIKNMFIKKQTFNSYEI